MEDRQTWNISKDVNLTFVVGMVIHCLFLSWFASKFDSRLENAEKWIEANGHVGMRLEAVSINQKVLSENIMEIRSELKEIKGAVYAMQYKKQGGK